MKLTSAVAIVIAIILAGCAASKEPEPVGAASLTTAPAGDGNASIPQPSPTALYLAADGGLALTPPTQEATRAVDVPVNGPMWENGDYPTWSAKFDHDIVVGGNVTIHLFVTTTSASVAANTVPVFSELPAVGFELSAGNTSVSAGLDGPTLIHAGEVVDLSATVDLGPATHVSAGTEVSINVPVYYAHAGGAEEFTFLMGPDHPSGLAP